MQSYENMHVIATIFFISALTQKVQYLRVRTLEPDAVYMAVVDNGEIIWSHQYTFEFSQMIDIGKKLVKIIAENNTSSFIGRICGTQV